MYATISNDFVHIFVEFDRDIVTPFVFLHLNFTLHSVSFKSVCLIFLKYLSGFRSEAFICIFYSWVLFF